MLSKLIKHEFKATCNAFFLLFCSLIGMTILTRLSKAIPADNTIFALVKVLITVLYVILLIGLLLFGVIIMLRRFNVNLLRDEGYLTHTLPVKMWQHLTAKMITYTVWFFASLGVLFLSFTIFFVGTKTYNIVPDALVELAKAIKTYPVMILLIIEIILSGILVFVTTMLNIFAALSLGQIFRQHKIAGSVLFYFVLNTAMGFISMISMIYMPIIEHQMNRIERISNSGVSYHHKVNVVTDNILLILLFYIVMYIIESVIYFVITNYMLSKKLNLD